MDWLTLIYGAIFSAVAFMSLFYLLASVKKDVSIVDIAWGLVFIFINLVFLVQDENVTVPIALISFFILTWGSRLAIHLMIRKRGKAEDWRYANWRKAWGKSFVWRSYLQIFVLQALISVIIIAPLLVSRHESNVNILDDHFYFTFAGSALWWMGFLFESLGDWQLSRFLSDKKNKGKIMTSGLWKYTRHPNYFGEISMWWGLWLIVAPLNYGIFAVISPLTITYLLLKVSGITMLEKKYENNKAFQTYKKKTSALIPLPAKK